MQRKNVSFEQLSDIMAFRVVVGRSRLLSRAGCDPQPLPGVPGRFKDYISTPKPNGYRSLHTGVIGPERQRIEVQIRTATCTRSPNSASPRTGATSRAKQHRY
jgi:guanosine-3',5'-bis(diphosphate) 3'-pyrophosphohydrolase